MLNGVGDYLNGLKSISDIIKTEYTLYSINQANNIKKYGIIDEAPKRKYEEGVTIDGIESKDLDDAIWCDRKNNGGYCVWIHISDVTEAVKIYSPLDIEAMKRTTSIYRKNGVINMFPQILSEDILSLNENGTKLTLTIQIDLDNQGKMYNSKVYESEFKNNKRYDYESFLDDFINPESKNHKTLQLMYEIALKRKNIRNIEGSVMGLDESDRQLFIGEKEEKIYDFKKNIPKNIIEEFMILANIASAIVCVKNGYDSIFRCHNDLLERAFYTNKVGIHKGLATQNYTHFTSPIRRYADDIIHRVLKIMHIRGEKNPYSSNDILNFSKHINYVRTAVDIIGKKFDDELKTKEKINKLKTKNGDKLNTSHFTKDIKNNHFSNKNLPKTIANEIINDIENGHIGGWAWAIPVLLVSNEKNIKDVLFKAILNDNKFKPKSIIGILNSDKMIGFNINEILNESENKVSIIVSYKDKELFVISDNYGKRGSYALIIGNLRKRVIKKIFTHFKIF